MKIAFLFPGQGAQKVGMGKDLYQKYQDVKRVFGKASEISGIDVATLCFNGIRQDYIGKEYVELNQEGEDLNKTENTQIAIATMSLAILELIKKEGIKADIASGLSLGEYPALIYGGYLSFEDGIRLLKKRGYLMQYRLPREEYKMLAIIGLESSKIEEIISKINDEKEMFLKPANYNYSNQTVISGTKKAIEKVIPILKENGAKKVVELKTSGPFHTALLEKAKNEYKKELENIEFKIGNIDIIKNIDGEIYSDTDNMNEILAEHIVNPVRFDKAIKLMNDKKIDTFVEIGPGKALTGFIKKELSDVNVINIYDVESYENAINLLKN